ncbi:tetratricopeptide repeat protein [Olleya aquimaris]|uniref:Tetratricopeptide repeat protein n=1 Tax=Olleya aquimaris TaxID=639310 RepID=A0A327RGC8_9FLAO|nr:tetratricopeptide repeat protein [Olleya aquimaris]RAJ15002.1 tetratricopeptide repeat protein [Olleya aquimaris]
MMFKRFLILICITFSYALNAQEDLVAREYFNSGEFEKALSSYKKLYSKNTKNNNYLLKIVKIEQQLELFKDAEVRLLEAIQKRAAPDLLVELGYNYQLQKDTINANNYYNQAITTLDDNANNAYRVGRTFENLSLLDQAITTYNKAMELKPILNFSMQLARIYGEQGEIEKMFSSYIDFAEANPNYIDSIKRYVSDFISEDNTNENNIFLRKILLKKIQQSPNLMWNEMLSWLFIQQKEFNKAFAQEKAIYKRELESLDRIIELGLIAENQKQYEEALSIFNFIIETTQDIDTKLTGHLKVLQIKTKIGLPETYQDIKTDYVSIFETYGKTPQTLDLQVNYAHFLAFYLDNSTEAIALLKDTLTYNIPERELAIVKLELGDILVLEEKFNQALIYYTQIERNLKNSTLAQEARFRVAKTSYYKGDFKWAESQLKILKSSTSQLTANDALDLKLLISDNRAEDSLQRALKKYAKADLLAFQNKNNDAIKILDQILEDHKTEVIIPQALLKQALLFEKLQDFEKAKNNYQRIIKDFKDSILMDNALYNLAELFVNQLAQPEEAKKLYETLLFNHSDSIFAVEARKKFRALRGDALN